MGQLMLHDVIIMPGFVIHTAICIQEHPQTETEHTRAQPEI